MHRINLVHQII